MVGSRTQLRVQRTPSSTNSATLAAAVMWSRVSWQSPSSTTAVARSRWRRRLPLARVPFSTASQPKTAAGDEALDSCRSWRGRSKTYTCLWRRQPRTHGCSLRRTSSTSFPPLPHHDGNRERCAAYGCSTCRHQHSACLDTCLSTQHPLQCTPRGNRGGDSGTQDRVVEQTVVPAPQMSGKRGSGSARASRGHSRRGRARSSVSGRHCGRCAVHALQVDRGPCPSMNARSYKEYIAEAIRIAQLVRKAEFDRQSALRCARLLTTGPTV